MDHNLNGNKCVCCGEYAVEGSWLCWRCQQGITNTKSVKDSFIKKLKKHLTKIVKRDIIQILQTKQHKIIIKNKEKSYD